MSASGGNSDFFRSPAGSTIGGNGAGGGSRRYGLPFSVSDLIQAPLSALLEYSGILRPRSVHLESESLSGRRIIASTGERAPGQVDESFVTDSRDGEVSIRIFDVGDQENPRTSAGIQQPLSVGPLREGSLGDHGVSMEQMQMDSERQRGDGGSSDAGVGVSTFAGATQSPSVLGVGGQSVEGEGSVAGGNARDSAYQRYDIQQAARCIEQVLPFSLLLLVVFIRQHLQGFFITIWLSAVMFKSNDLLCKQTALKGERKISVLVGIGVIFTIHVIGVYWWYCNEELLYPLVLLPPSEVPPFWHAIFIIMVNDTMVRQAAMAVKCVLLVCYKNSRGCNYRKQGQLLTIVEYLVLLYRALLPTPVWYRFFLNKEYGSLFSSLTTGLYLTFKLTSVVEKVQSFMSAVKALSRKEMHYGSHATVDQVIAAGDTCAICQERMHAPILLRCKHIFCEDCVSEWFERERTCPLCRALVKPADLRSFSDGSTSLFFQIF
ncbi:RING finger and transmembrane domain-containing protein 2-like [Phalaenopsis equestris]|uniref:RING finger and transmembrane domain-containing protein 2-like n=1 Tax=Phalaenopsis equestris TaxID=78828 RepID=UPI0009E45E2A|nr:RING finger and transmembrane domain-containing protein 2-like [Phalaenopsis equestris]